MYIYSSNQIVHLIRKSQMGSHGERWYIRPTWAVLPALALGVIHRRHHEELGKLHRHWTLWLMWPIQNMFLNFCLNVSYFVRWLCSSSPSPRPRWSRTSFHRHSGTTSWVMTSSENLGLGTNHLKAFNQFYSPTSWNLSFWLLRESDVWACEPWLLLPQHWGCNTLE